MKRLPSIVFYVLIAFLVTSCEKQSSTSRQYTEITLQPQSRPVSDPHQGMDINVDPHAFMKDAPMGDPHAGFSKEQLEQMLKEQGAALEPAGKAPFTWVLPTDWQEKPASGMRLASFVNSKDPSGIDCSIVPLGGGAGGLTANIARWMQQINIPVGSDKELEAFAARQEKFKIAGDLEVLVIDFTTLQKDAASVPSMIAAIIQLPEQRIFVKMTGTKDKVIANRQSFLALTRSLKF